MKTFELKSVVMGCIRYEYFYKQEKNDTNGNPRFRVYLIDPECNAVYESIFKGYEFQMKDYVLVTLEKMINKRVGFE